MTLKNLVDFYPLDIKLERCFGRGKMCEVTIGARSISVSSEIGIFFQAAICTFNSVTGQTVSNTAKTHYLAARDNS